MTSTSTLTISVMVPTYRRPADLKRCLDALRAQARPADEVLVVARPEDDATHRALADELAANNPFELRVIETGLGRRRSPRLIAGLTRRAATSSRSLTTTRRVSTGWRGLMRPSAMIRRSARSAAVTGCSSALRCLTANARRSA